MSYNSNALAKIAAGGFAQSYWLTNAAKALTNRDPLDAISDVEALLAALKADLLDGGEA